MGLLKKERFILWFIKFTPAIFLVFLLVVATVYIYYQYINTLKKDQVHIKEKYITTYQYQINQNMQTINRYIQDNLKYSEKNLKEDLLSKIDNVYNIAFNIYEKNKDTSQKEQIIKQIKDAVEPIRFADGNGYFSIHTIDGINILHPINKSFEGKSVLYRKDSSGNYPVKTAIEIANTNKQGFFTWYYYKPKDRSKEFKKFGVVKKFEPYNLIITTAIYEDDFKNHIKQNILTHLKMLRYKDQEYIFVFNTKGDVLLTKAHRKKFIVENSSFSKKFKEFLNSNKKEEYIEYLFHDTDTKYSKISFIKKIEELDWVIGTGFNFDKLNLLIKENQVDLNKKFVTNTKTILISALFILIIFLIISSYFSQSIKRIFYSYKNDLIEKETKEFESIMEELNNILDNVPMMYAYKDTKNNILKVNQVFAEMYKCKTEELIDIPTKKLFPENYKEYYEQDLKILKTKKPIIGKIQCYKIDGKTITVESTKIPIFNKKGKISNIVLFNHNITEKLKQEKELEVKTKKLFEQKSEILANYKQTIISLVDLIEQRDYYTAGHSHRVATYAVKIAEAMNFSVKEIDLLRQIALLHDIGKVAIPDSILLKPGKLTKQEFNIIKNHSLLGFDVISKIPMFNDFSQIILSHHERYNGSGYPKGLKKEEIPILASILSVADSFDAMTSTRIYNKTKTIDEALNELKEGSGTLFDPKIVKVALETLKDVDISENIKSTQLPKTDVEKERLAYFFKDNLTDTLNENYFELIFKQNLQEGKCINFIITHNFNNYNKKFGWKAGDELLITIVKLIKKHYKVKELFRFQRSKFLLLNEEHVQIDIDILNKELKEYDISSELRHFDGNGFDDYDTLIDALKK